MRRLRDKIFPNTDIRVSDTSLAIETYLRKKHDDGFYYLSRVYVQHAITRDVSIVRQSQILLDNFNHMVYGHLLYCKIDPNLRDIHNTPVFLKDPNQEDDLQRIFILHS